MTSKTVKKQSAPKANEAKLKPPEVVFVPEEMPTVYVNHAQIAFSNFDVSIIIGELSGLDKNGNLAIHPRARLVMAQPFLEEFAKLLYRNITAHHKHEEQAALALAKLESDNKDNDQPTS